MADMFHSVRCIETIIHLGKNFNNLRFRILISNCETMQFLIGHTVNIS